MSFNIGKLSVTIAGESHAKALSVIIEGIPAGVKIDSFKLRDFMKRRVPGKNKYSTSRNETDIPVILSGIKNGFSTGAPISAMIENNDTRSRDYGEKLDVPRPAHADYPASVKFGEYFDFCGGGQFSGRLTAAMCFAGGIAKELLSSKGIEVCAHIASIHGIEDESYSSGISDVSEKEFPVISDAAGELMKAEIDKARMSGDSVGGCIECAVTGLSPGIGDALYGGLDGELAKAVFAVPAVKGVEFGAGFDVCGMLGSENNDEYFTDGNDIKTTTNNHGGILGGMSSGMPILLRVAMKPTPSIARKQNSVSLSKHKNVELEINGRHDPCVVPRAVPCIESMCALAILGKIL